MDTTSIDEITSDMCDCQYTCWFVLLINFSIRLDSDTVRVEKFLQMCGEQRQQPAVDAAAVLLARSIRRPAGDRQHRARLRELQVQNLCRLAWYAVV